MNSFPHAVLGTSLLMGALTACGSSSNSADSTQASGGSGAVGGNYATGGTHTGAGGLGSTTGGTRSNLGGLGSTGGTHAVTTTTGGTGAAANMTALCTAEARIASQLQCPGYTSQQDTASACMQQSNGVPTSCQTASDAVAACLDQQPVSSFKCSSSNDGSFDATGNICAAESNALTTCALGTTIDAGCADLAPCCAQMTGSTATNCQQVLTGGNDVACGLSLAIYQGVGACS